MPKRPSHAMVKHVIVSRPSEAYIPGGVCLFQDKLIVTVELTRLTDDK